MFREWRFPLRMFIILYQLMNVFCVLFEQRKRESQGSDEETPSKLEKKKSKKDKKKSKEKEKEKEKGSSDEVSMVDVLVLKMDP